MLNQLPMPGYTVVQKLNQGVSGNRAVYLFPGSFFGPFLTRKKGQENKVELLLIVSGRHETWKGICFYLYLQSQLTALS